MQDGAQILHCRPTRSFNYHLRTTRNYHIRQGLTRLTESAPETQAGDFPQWIQRYFQAFEAVGKGKLCNSISGAAQSHWIKVRCQGVFEGNTEDRLHGTRITANGDQYAPDPRTPKYHKVLRNIRNRQYDLCADRVPLWRHFG